ncbi:MAG: MBL fold metallo-hydrolase [Treponema sp.]|nr:MBL fold metallo-hydrolase [Candidatus Treponema equifaecale]
MAENLQLSQIAQQVSRHITLLKMATNTGILNVPKKDGKSDVYLIESGNDDTSGLKLLELIAEMFPQGKLKAVINTHSHADHCGGNAILVEKTGCEIWASKGEASLMEYPSIETQLIWGGTPIHDILSKFLLARPCHVTKIFDGEELIHIPVEAENSEITLQIVSLPGHYVDQTGLLFTDTDGKKIFFAGDALSGRNVIKTYWIQYLLDERQTKESLHKVSQVQADLYIPGHGDSVDSVDGIVELNLLAILETENMILDELKTPKTTEEILKAVADRNLITLRTSQFCLIGSTLRSYLTGLYESGKITYEIQNNSWKWKRNNA